MDNLELYNQLRKVPQEAQKPFHNGRYKGTDINPMWRIKRLTEVFGACGIGWYFEVCNREYIQCPDGEMLSFVSINLYIKNNGEWSKPIYGEGGNKMVQKDYNSDEAYKMSLTDAISNASKYLGLGADIWYEKDVRYETKYAQQVESMQKKYKTLEEYGKNDKLPEYIPYVQVEMSHCKTKNELRMLCRSLNDEAKGILINEFKRVADKLPEKLGE